jgi:hypothetical protein
MLFLDAICEIDQLICAQRAESDRILLTCVCCAAGEDGDSKEILYEYCASLLDDNPSAAGAAGVSAAAAK